MPLPADDLFELALEKMTFPARQGVHQPQDSSTKNSMKLSDDLEDVPPRAEDDDGPARGQVVEGDLPLEALP